MGPCYPFPFCVTSNQETLINPTPLNPSSFNSPYPQPSKTYLLLKRKNMCNTSIDRITKSSLSLITDSHDSIEPLMNRYIHQKLRNVACTEHLMHRREVLCSLFRIKVRREDAPGHALPPQELACSARPTAAASDSAAASATAAACTHHLLLVVLVDFVSVFYGMAKSG